MITYKRNYTIRLFAIISALCVNIMAYAQYDQVDLGLSVIWRNANEGAERVGDKGYFLGIDDIGSSDDGSIESFRTYESSEYYGLTYIDEEEPYFWRFPTKEEIEELFFKCRKEWAGDGYWFYGPNGNRIFIPTAGGILQGEHIGENKSCILWSSSKTFNPVGINFAYIGSEIGWYSTNRSDFLLSARLVLDRHPEVSYIDADTSIDILDGEDVYVITERMPEFIGGNLALTSFLEEHTRYPLRALEKGIEGRVFISFIVDKNGNIRNVHPSFPKNYDLDNEACRVVKGTKGHWIPGKQKGKNVNISYTVPINFVLQ